MFSLGLAAASFTAPSSRAPPARCARRCIAPRCSGTTDVEAIVHACLEGPTSSLPSEAKGRVEAYVRELLRYNERTNVYSKSAYEHLPFHVQDSVVLAQHLATQQPSGGSVLDLGSGSGLPSIVLACVMPDRPVFAIESKSRKTRFLKQVSRKLELPLYTPLTQNVKECYAYSVFDVPAVTAKAFKPVPEVGPIARRCVLGEATLHIPISEAQVAQYELTEDQLVRQGRFLYYQEALTASHGAAQRNLVRPGDAR